MKPIGCVIVKKKIIKKIRPEDFALEIRAIQLLLLNTPNKPQVALWWLAAVRLVTSLSRCDRERSVERWKTWNAQSIYFEFADAGRRLSLFVLLVLRESRQGLRRRSGGGVLLRPEYKQPQSGDCCQMFCLFFGAGVFAVNVTEAAAVVSLREI